MASTLELQPLLRLILDQLKSVLDYTGASIFIREGDKVVNVEYRGPIPAEEAMKVNISKRSGVEEVLRRRQPVIIDDVHADTPIAQGFMASGGDYMNTTFSYIHSWMGVPLMSKEWVIGVLCLDYDQPNYYTPQHARLALAIAKPGRHCHRECAAIRAGAATGGIGRTPAPGDANCTTRFRRRSMASRWARARARTLLERDPSKVAAPLDYVLSLAEAGLAEMRALIFELRPESLGDRKGLVSGVEQAGRRHARA